MSFGRYIEMQIALFTVDKNRIEKNIQEVEELKEDDEFEFDLTNGYRLELKDVEEKISICINALKQLEEDYNRQRHIETCRSRKI